MKLIDPIEYQKPTSPQRLFSRGLRAASDISPLEDTISVLLKDPPYCYKFLDLAASFKPRFLFLQSILSH